MTPMNDTPNDPHQPDAPRDAARRDNSSIDGASDRILRAIEPCRGYTLAALSGMFAFSELIAMAALQVKADRAREGFA